MEGMGGRGRGEGMAIVVIVVMRRLITTQTGTPVKGVVVVMAVKEVVVKEAVAMAVLQQLHLYA
jgi:hypothetical protein